VRDDLDALPEASLRLELVPIAEALEKVWRGTPDEEALKKVERLRDAALAKLRHGPERFAGPGELAVAPTPRTLVGRSGPLELYRYRPGPGAAPRKGAPLLIVYSLINRSYVLDLLEGASFVRHLLDGGLDVFLVEWGEARRWDDTLTLDHVLRRALPELLDVVEETTGARRVSLLGHCMGGVFASLLAAVHPDRIDRLVTLTTPFTGAHGGVVSLFADRALFPLEAIVGTFGVMPGKLIRTSVILMKPYYELMRWRVFLDTVGHDVGHRFFLAADAWVNDNPDLPGALFSSFVREVYFEDRLRKGETVVGGTRVDLGSVTCPVLNVAARRDWVVPPASAELGSTLFGRGHRPRRGAPRSRFQLVDGFHVSLFFDPRLFGTWDLVREFLLEGAPRERVPVVQRSKTGGRSGLKTAGRKT